MSQSPSKSQKAATVLDRLEKTNQDGTPYENHHQPVNGHIGIEQDHQAHQNNQVWNMPFRECGLYNKALKQQVERENKVLMRDNARKPSERKKYVNLFAGLDNSNPMNFEELKRSTFRSIFSCTNSNAVCLKKPLNFINYSNERLDIISKNQRNTAYDNFWDQCLEYDSIKAPFFDHELNQYMTIKRQRDTLDRNSKKYITKNIKTCAPLARNQREKVKKAVILRNPGKFMKSQPVSPKIGNLFNRKLSEPQILTGDISITNDSKTAKKPSKKRRPQSTLLEREQQLPEGYDRQHEMNMLRQRRIQIIRRNRNYSSTIQNTEPIQAAIVPPQSNNQSVEGFAEDQRKNPVVFQRQIRSQIGTRRPFNEELQIEVPMEKDFRQKIFENTSENNLKRFKLNQQSSNMNQKNTMFANPEPISLNEDSLSFFDRQTSKNQIQPSNRKADQGSIKFDDAKSQAAEQMKRRSLSSHCKRRQNNNNTTIDHRFNIQLLEDQAKLAYQPKDQSNVDKRLRNFQKFVTSAMREDPIVASDKKKEAVRYAVSYLDKLANKQHPEIISQEITLNNYDWPTQKVSPSKQLYGLDGMDAKGDSIFNDDAQSVIDLKEEEILIDRVLFTKSVEHQGDQQQGNNDQEIRDKALEKELIKEKHKNRELQEAIFKLSGKLRDLQKITLRK